MERNFMSKYIDCTMPFYDYMPVGNVWAWDVPFRTDPITTPAKNSYELWMITMHSETGTRLMIKAMQDPNAPTVDRLPLNEFLNRDAVILDCLLYTSILWTSSQPMIYMFPWRQWENATVIILTIWRKHRLWWNQCHILSCAWFWTFIIWNRAGRPIWT